MIKAVEHSSMVDGLECCGLPWQSPGNSGGGRRSFIKDVQAAADVFWLGAWSPEPGARSVATLVPMRLGSQADSYALRHNLTASHVPASEREHE
ncbi:hypothetical protein E4U42_002785 [Claviceps africana]|uniref:Uncharacterized protein n=1 Tax=Claviceps africana TaxID=83212 RepID=A0A8K0J8Z6_9HYPO|nr:hypothetical protein E4U42_002785 [Claviceps africana]